MINKEIAKNLVVHMNQLEHFHRVVQLCQESFGPSIKAYLRAVGIEHPKEHDVSDAPIENKGRFPK